MKRYTSKTLLAIVLLVALKLFLLNPAFAASDCNLICEASYVIDDIDTTADLEALPGCISVTGDLSIISSPLDSLEGLKCLTHVRGELVIERNDSLTSLAGLESLKSVGGDLQIEDTSQLCTSLAVDLSKQVDIGQSTRIYGNKPDC